MADDSRTTAPERPPVTQPLTASGFLHNAWYMAGWVEDCAQRPLTPRTVLGEPIVLFKTAQGQWVALEDRCAHRFAPLSRGHIVEGCKLQCPYHGLQYDAAGACVFNPHGNRRIPPQARVQSWPVVEKHKALWVWMGGAPARPDELPDFSVRDEAPALHGTRLDYLSIAANYQLIADNLLDLSHTSYLHEGILGNAETVQSQIKCDQEGRDVLVSRHASNVAAPGMFAQFWPDHPGKVDKFTAMRWMAPSNMRLISGICAVGAEPMSGTGYYALHMLTPADQHSTHYFFTAVRFGVKTTDLELNLALQEKIATMRRFAFAEQDAPVIEAQQRILDQADRTLDPVLLEIDAGPVRYKRVLNQLLRAEQS